jgi:hypothetical protein
MTNIPFFDFALFYGFFFILGAIFGSFACCQAWRIHERLNQRSLGARSICLNCHHRLAWYDNLPIFSWLALRGRCRYCRHPIGFAEILSEFGLGFTFVLIAHHFLFNSISSISSPLVFLTAATSQSAILIPFLILLVSFVLFWILLIYDAKWGELPVFLMLLLIPLALAFHLTTTEKLNLLQPILAIGLLAGLYYLLYFFSHEKLVGGGDWLLCISIAIFLGRLELALFELFLSNFLASLFSLPQILRKSRTPIPFGPFLILALLLILSFKSTLLHFFALS